VQCIIYSEVQLGTTFVGMPQSDHGAEQAQMLIYLGTRFYGSECMSLEQPFGLVLLQ